jgi:Asp-tRNA(Asn)/Glu-tRNA(Gln) amidotransferase A subunit family amidase
LPRWTDAGGVGCAIALTAVLSPAWAAAPAAGRVGNAYDPWLSPGGSSSGSAVAVGAGFVPLALCSDNCGSLRLPAVCNGAVTLRPTQGASPAPACCRSVWSMAPRA